MDPSWPSYSKLPNLNTIMLRVTKGSAASSRTRDSITKLWEPARLYRNSVIEVNGMRFLARGSNTLASGYYEVPLNSEGVYVRAQRRRPQSPLPHRFSLVFRCKSRIVSWSLFLPVASILSLRFFAQRRYRGTIGFLAVSRYFVRRAWVTRD